MNKDLNAQDRLARLRGIRQKLQSVAGTNYSSYLDFIQLNDNDPLVEDPYRVPNTFISERVGGSISVIDQNGDHLADENLNQFLSNFLPGGYKRRWGNFGLYRGNWDFRSENGFADVGPMIDRSDSYPLRSMISNAETVPYGPIQFQVDDVTVYVPEGMVVTDENLKRDYVNYVWLPDLGIVWTGNPPVENIQPLSSDPTINVLWFKHPLGELPEITESVTDSDLIEGYGFTDAIEFLRCYYASLLTLYPKGSTETKSGIVRYRHEEDETIAFVGSKEQSQLLTFSLRRDNLRERIKQAFERDPHLRRDLQFSFVRTKIWEDLFFERETIPHEYAIEPLVEHLIGVDHELRLEDEESIGVFGLSGSQLPKKVKRLLPNDKQGNESRLRLLGHPPDTDSLFYEIINNHSDEFARTLALCRNDSQLLEFAEYVLIHSAEHALATWSNEYTGSGTSFELWYDVNFQSNNKELAQIAVYDPIQGGSGLAKEVHKKYVKDDTTDITAGLADQGDCHTGLADRAAIVLLAEHSGTVLYDLFHNDSESFLDIVEATLENVSDDTGYNKADLKTAITKRARSFLQTRDLAVFYAYVAEQHEIVGERIARTPRVADLALHLDQHVIRNPTVRATYDQFAAGSGRRDLSELGDRLQELTVGCITACPDCLQTDTSLCLHGNGPQRAYLNRRLLTEVFNG